jgi:Zn-finger nucleic acid-binding protein
MKAFQPIHTFKSSLITFACLFSVFLIFGLVTLISALKVVETSVRYDNKAGCKGNWTDPGECDVIIEVSDEMESPVFLYYELHNYFQNHRMYMKSRDDKQLAGTADGTTLYCDPVENMEDIGPRCGNKTAGFYYCSVSGERLTRSDSASPCGLMAKSLFNGED